MDPDIEFVYEGKHYTVGSKAYYLNRIVLPDGRILEANEWLESLPPQPVGLHEVPHLYVDLPPDEIARQMNGVVAEEAMVVILARRRLRGSGIEVIAFQTTDGKYLTSELTPMWSFGTSMTFEGPNAEAEAKAYAASHNLTIQEPGQTT